MPAPYYGKYRGKVENNLDPMSRGRLQVSCPAVLGPGTLSWALPCVPYAASGKGLYLIPPIDASILVEFEAGDPDRPIWSGCFWDTGDQLPATPALPTTKILKTDAIELTLDDIPAKGGFTLKVGSPAVAMPMTIEMTVSGIKLSIAQSTIELTPSGVQINGTNLVVLP